MKKSVILIVLITLISAVSVWPETAEVNITRTLSSIPLAFTENQGQWNDQVLFRANAGGGATMWFTSTGACYQLTRRISADNTTDDSPGVTGRRGRRPEPCQSVMIKASFVGANPNPAVVGEDILEYKCNYFLGNNPARWKTDVPNYNTIVYQDIYSGIDLRYYGNGKQLEYDFIVSPGADLSCIRIRYEGVEAVSVNEAGELVVRTMWGQVTESRPIVHQLDNGSRISLEGRYVLHGNNSFGFSLNNNYDPTLPLIIDPFLSYSTYLGGTYYDGACDIAINYSGDSWVIGYTLSPDFPTFNPYQTYADGYDVFVTRIDDDGSSLIFSTFLGGYSEDLGTGIAIDPVGYAHITGYTYSDDFPTVNAYQSYATGPPEAFVAKLSPAGNSLDFSTYLSGRYEDYGEAVAVDMYGRAYVCGSTSSDDFPTAHAYQAYYQGATDAFVAKFTEDGTNLVYSTFLGGSSDDYGWGLAVLDPGWAYVTGFTTSSNFPTLYPYQTYQGGRDVFVTKFDESGSGVFYSTYLGGSYDDCADDITINAAGEAFVAGWTTSTDFPTLNAYQTDQPGEDCFITKLNAAGSGLLYSTYLGGNGRDRALGIGRGIGETVYITGYTNSLDYPLVSPAQPTFGGGYDAIVSRIGEYGNVLHSSTYLGGSDSDGGWALAILGYGLMYVAGFTQSADFPLVDPYQTFQGGRDAFVAQISPGCCVLRGDVDHDADVDPIDVVYFVNYMWRGGPAPP